MARFLELWLLLLAVAVIWDFVAGRLLVNITILDELVSKGAVCLDGSPPAYYFHEGSASGSRNWLVHLEGGGWCDTIHDCAARSQTSLGSSMFMPKQREFGGIFSDSFFENPEFFNWNKVRIQYCDGGSFSGNLDSPLRTFTSTNETRTIMLRGQKIWAAVMVKLLSKGMNHANQALLVGGSSGGVSAVIHCNDFYRLLPRRTRVKCLSDAGFFIDIPDIFGHYSLRARFTRLAALHNAEPSLPKACTSEYGAQCFFPEYMVPYITMPLFIVNSAYDGWQLLHSFIPDEALFWEPCKSNFSTCSPSQLDIIQGYRDQFLSHLSAALVRHGWGVFITSCQVHCIVEADKTWSLTRVKNKKLQAAVADWYLGRKDEIKVVDCAYPCNSNCIEQGVFTMQHVVVDRIALASELRQCASTKSLTSGQHLHRFLVAQGCDGETLLGNLLVQMYGACKCPDEAKGAFDAIRERNVFSWNILIAAYNGRPKEAESSFSRMPSRGTVAWNAMVNTYANFGDLASAKQTFDCMVDRDVISWNSIINAYNDEGLLAEACELFNRMACFVVVSWNAMIVAYAQEGHLEESKSLFDSMPERNSISWNSTLAAFGARGLCSDAWLVYSTSPQWSVVTQNAMLSAFVRHGSVRGDAAEAFYSTMLVRDLVSWNTMVAANASSGYAAEAEYLFHRMPQQDAVSWNSVISGLVMSGDLQRAEALLERCPHKDSFAVNSLVTGFIRLGNAEKGKSIFDSAQNRGVVSWNALLVEGSAASDVAELAFGKMPCRDLVSWTLLIEAYFRCGHLQQALQLADDIPQKDIVTWTTIVSALASNDRLDDAIAAFDVMPWHNAVACHVGISTYATLGRLSCAESVFDSILQLDLVTWSHLILAYAQNGCMERVSAVFHRMPALDVSSCTTVLVGYSQAGDLRRARALFEDMQNKDVVSWNAMLGAYAYSSSLDVDCPSLELFKLMDLEGHRPEALTFATIFDACNKTGDLEFGMLVHELAMDCGFDRTSIRVGNALVNMYAKCGRLDRLQYSFDRMLKPDCDSWGALVTTYAQLGYMQDSFATFLNMDMEGVEPSTSTVVTMLDMFAKSLDLVNGKRTFDHIAGSHLQQSVHVSTAAVNMFAKCGDLASSSLAFEAMAERNVVSWNAMLSGFSQAGMGDEALQVFLSMVLDGQKPTARTLVSVLSACSHTGLLEQGCRAFANMSPDFGVSAVPFHCACVVDMLVRAGKTAEASWVVSCSDHDAASWMSLLGGCFTQGDVENGRQAAMHVVRLEGEDSAAYVMLSKVYTSAFLPPEEVVKWKKVGC